MPKLLQRLWTLVAGPDHPKPPVRRRRPLRLEGLEDRCVPATLTVTTASDAVVHTGLSLRDAIAASAAGGTIVFAPSLAGQTITLKQGELQLTKSITIQGLGAASLTISGNGASRIFEVETGTAQISGLTLTDGNGVGVGTSGDGGAIAVDIGSTLNLGSCLVTGNNTGINNTSFGGGVLFLGAGTILNCAVVNNGSGAGGGSGIAAESANTVTVQNSTISNNRSSNGSGISDTGNANGDGTMNILNCTVTGNTGSGGVKGSDCTINLSNSIVAGNTNGGTPSDLFVFGPAGARINARYSLIQAPNGLINGANQNNIIGVVPKLGPLQNNGGQTPTEALLAGSPAIDAGSTALVPPGVTTDQRGPGFPRIVNGMVDIGAFEVQPPPARIGRRWNR